MGPEFDPKVLELIWLVTVVSNPKLWPDEEVARATKLLTTEYGKTPSLADVAVRFGADPVFEAAERIIKGRIALLEQVVEQRGLGSVCHFCGNSRRDTDPAYEFGLAKEIETKFNWGAAGLLAANVLTVPLGLRVAPRSLTSTRATIARCRLVLCERCANTRRGFFGGLKVSPEDCSRHPSWQRLHREGFVTFFDQEQLGKFE